MYNEEKLGVSNSFQFRAHRDTGGGHVDMYTEAIFRLLLEALNKGVKKGSTPLGLRDQAVFSDVFQISTQNNNFIFV